MRLGVWGAALGLAAVLWVGSPANGQENPAKQAETPAKKSPAAVSPREQTENESEKPKGAPSTLTPAERFAAAHKKWTELDTKLNELTRQFNFAPSSEERAVLRERYQALVTESEKLLPELRAAAEAAFAAEPAKDADVTKILVGLVAYEFRRDEYDAALALAKTLVDAKVEEPALYAIAGVAAFRLDDYELAETYLKTAEKANKLDKEGRESLTQIPKQKELWHKEQAIRAKEAEANDLPRVKLETSKGSIVLELFENEAPQTVGNFISLVEGKKYDKTTFHRVLGGFMAQGGDPKGTGEGGPGYEIYCECYRDDYRHHFRGSLSMAHAGRDTGGSQFFLTFRPTTHLDGKHTVFGRVVEGMEVLAKLQRRDPQSSNLPEPDRIVSATVLRKRMHDYQPTKVEPKPESKAGTKSETKSPDDKKSDEKKSTPTK